MIRRLKYKILITIMCFITVIISLLVIIVNKVTVDTNKLNTRLLLSATISTYKINSLEKQLSNNVTIQILSPYDTLVIELQKNGDLISNISNSDNLSDKDFLAKIIPTIRKRKKRFGMYENYCYLKREKKHKTLICIIDYSPILKEERQLLIYSVSLGTIFWIIFLWLSIYLVKLMTKPITTVLKQQKQFISDAGHELKTPLAIISANTCVLNSEIGENQWLSNIETAQTQMKHLSNRLMALSDLEDFKKSTLHHPFDLSQAVLEVSLPFESLAYEHGIRIDYNVKPNIQLTGDKDKINQLLTALIENAISYCNEKGLIRISLEKYNRKIELSVYNTGMGVKEEERELIFERFYRVDEARERKEEHHGLGLSIVKAIVEEHKGKIHVLGTYQKDICFKIIFNEKKLK